MKRFFLVMGIGVAALCGVAQNPIVTQVFTADPAAMVYNDTVYLYTGHDEATPTGTFYVMNDWQCFTTTDMVNWTPKGEVFNVNKVSWASGDAWAGEVEPRNGKFYFYFCAEHKTIAGKAVGVAVADSPYGPFTDIGTPLITNNMTTTISSTWDDIDPTVFIDADGQAYMYWGNSQCYYVKLKENMTEIDGAITPINLPSYTEAPYLHQRDSMYYLSYAYQWPEKIAYASSKSITGPWTFKAVLNNNVNNCGTNHQSIIEFKNQWYFIYHTGDIGGDYRRSVAVDYLYYNPDNTLREVVQTPYGVQSVEVTSACPPIPVSPFSKANNNAISRAYEFSLETGDSVQFLPRSYASGTWSWEGPNGFTSADSVVLLKDLTRQMAGKYYATFTNQCGTKSYISFGLEVNYALPENITSGKTYVVEPLNSNKVMSIQNQASANGSNVMQDIDHGYASQKFILTLVDNLYWKITPSHIPTRAVDVFNISTEDGANIVIWDYWGGAGQQWQLAEIQQGVYAIISRNSQKCLDVNPIDNNIRQWTCTGANNQLFKLNEFTVSASDALQTNQVVIYPNPQQAGNINITAQNNAKLLQVNCYNSAGSLIDSIPLNNATEYTYQQQLTPGVYLFKIATTTGLFNETIIIE